MTLEAEYDKLIRCLFDKLRQDVECKAISIERAKELAELIKQRTKVSDVDLDNMLTSPGWVLDEEYNRSMDDAWCSSGCNQ